jgi:glycosyltransferase involved in cell wall biosynthesis
VSCTGPCDREVGFLQFDVLMLTTAHSATDDRIFHREAKSLAEAGLSVCIMGPHDKSGPIDGVWIDALPRPSSRWKRLALSWVVVRRCVHTNSKLFLFHDPELFAVAIVLRLLRRNVIYDCHENVHLQVLQKGWIPAWARRPTAIVVRISEWLLSRMMSGVIAATPSIGARFPADRTILVRNFPTTSAMKCLAAGPSIDSRNDVVIYTGCLSRVRGIKELSEAFRGHELGRAELWLVGDFGDDKFKAEILSSLSPNVKWLGWMEHGQVLRLYQQAKVGVVLLYPTPSHRNALPIKLFEYFGAGLPVVASNYPEMISLVGECGFCVDPHNVEAVRTAIVTILSDPARAAKMGVLARDRVLTTMSWAGEAERLTNFCHSLR